jgi:hypothetical protein
MNGEITSLQLSVESHRSPEVEGAQLLQGLDPPERQGVLLSDRQAALEGGFRPAEIPKAVTAAEHVEGFASKFGLAFSVGNLKRRVCLLKRIFQSTFAERELRSQNVDLSAKRRVTRFLGQSVGEVKVMSGRVPLASRDGGADQL